MWILEAIQNRAVDEDFHSVRLLFSMKVLKLHFRFLLVQLWQAGDVSSHWIESESVWAVATLDLAANTASEQNAWGNTP